MAASISFDELEKLKSFAFTAQIAKLDIGLKHHYAAVPTDIAEYFAAQKVKRVILTINNVHYRRAIQGRKDGERRLVFGKDILKQSSLKLGDKVSIKIKTDPNPDQIDIPEEFIEVLAQDEDAGKKFYAMTAGKQRSLCIYVDQVKGIDSKIKRALELAHKIKTNTLYGYKKD